MPKPSSKKLSTPKPVYLGRPAWEEHVAAVSDAIILIIIATLFFTLGEATLIPQGVTTLLTLICS